MRNRLVYAAVGVVGVLLIGLAIASATAWRASDVLRASAVASQAIVFTDPGVLEMGGDPVTVTATVPAGDRVTLAIGRDTDVAGWVGAGPDQRIAGLAGWHTLALASPTASPAPSGPTPAGGTASAAPATGGAEPAPTTAGAAPVPTDAGTPTPAQSGTAGAGTAAGPTSATSTVPDATSDMWVATAQGTGSATLTWQAQPGRWSLLVVGSTGSGVGVPPTVSMAWPRTVTTPYLVPGTVAGGLLVLVSLLLLWRDLRRRHGGAAAWTPVLTGAIPVTGAAPSALTRRQMREMQEMARTGQLPVVVSAAPESPSNVAPAPVPSTGPGAAVEPAAARRPGPRETDPSAASARHDEPTAAGGPGGPGHVAAEAGTGVPAATGAHGIVDRLADRPRRPGDVPATEAAPTPTPATPAVPGGRRARRQAATLGPVVEPTVGTAVPGGSVPPEHPAPGVAGPAQPGAAARPTWMPRRSAAPSPDEPDVTAWSAGPDQAGSGSPSSTPRVAPVAPDTMRTPTAQPAWLGRVAARWDAEDADEAAPGAAEPPEGSAPAPAAAEPGSQPPRPAPEEVSRADAWRRAWGLPPLDTEEER